MKGKFGDFAIEMIAAALFFIFKDLIVAVFDGMFGDLIRGMVRGIFGGNPKEEGK